MIFRTIEENLYKNAFGVIKHKKLTFRAKMADWCVNRPKNPRFVRDTSPWVDTRVFYYFSTPFLLSVGALRGGSLDHFRARRARKLAPKAPF